MSSEEASGMCVPYSVRETADKGRGVFAAADIEMGTLIWRFVPGQYEVLDEERLRWRLENAAHKDAVDLLVHIISFEEFPGFMIDLHDAGALLNHGDSPNVKRRYGAKEYTGGGARSAQEVAVALTDDHFALFAACNLAEGEEMLMDYNAEPDDPEFYETACSKYGVTWDWL